MGISSIFNSAFCCIDTPALTWTTNSTTPGFPTSNWDIFNLETGDYFLKVEDLSLSHQITRYETFSISNKKSTCSANYLQNQIVLPGEDNCYDAGQTIYVAGNGTAFIVQSGGTATLIAGEKISFMPGTKVFEGGSMHGYITTTGQFCGNKSGGGSGNGEGIATDTLPNPNITANQVFRVYPNPTTGNFILELNGDNNGSSIQADIYSMQGEKIVAAEFKGEKKHEFSLAGYPPGLYFIRVVNGKDTGAGKIIRQ